MSETISFLNMQSGERLDKTVTAQLGEKLTRSQVQTIIHDGGVTINGVLAKPGIKLRGGEQIVIVLPDPRQDEATVAEPIPLDVVYEDKDLAVINKPAGMVVHPGAGVSHGTLVNAIMNRYPEIAEMNFAPQRRGIVHRLDKDTSGLIIIARRERAYHRLVAQFQRRTVEKNYTALLERTPPTPSGRITAPIARDQINRRRMAVMKGGRPAESEYQVIEWFPDDRALVNVKLLTGRTHQIRVHMAFINCPIVGDTVYGYRKVTLPLKRQFLHARHLCFDHPRTGERLCFESDLPSDLEQIVELLRKNTR